MNYQYLLKHPDLFQYVIGITHRQFELLLPKFNVALRQAEFVKTWDKERTRDPGGGSLEDLSSFNDEQVIRAIAAGWPDETAR